MGNDAGKVAVHEYVHIYTAAHQLYPDSSNFGWPIWLEEGRNRVSGLVPFRPERLAFFPGSNAGSTW